MVKVVSFGCRINSYESEIFKEKLKDVNVKWKNEHVACLVLASAGYPNKYEKGKIITGLDNVDDDIIVFHAGTTFNENNVVTNGGRVLSVIGCVVAFTLLFIKSYTLSHLSA